MYKENIYKDKNIKSKNTNKIDRGSINKKKSTSPTTYTFENSGGIITDNEYEVTTEFSDDRDISQKKDINK